MIVKYGPIRELLTSMEDEVIAIDLDKEYIGKSLEKYSPNIHSETIDITISSQHTLDDAIKILQKEEYKIKSIQPKSGKLEEFFLKSTGK